MEHTFVQIKNQYLVQYLKNITQTGDKDIVLKRNTLLNKFILSLIRKSNTPPQNEGVKIYFSKEDSFPIEKHFWKIDPDLKNAFNNYLKGLFDLEFNKFILQASFRKIPRIDAVDLFLKQHGLTNLLNEDALFKNNFRFKQPIYPNAFSKLKQYLINYDL